MNMAECIAASESKLIVMPWEPAQRLCPFALRMVAVRIMGQSKAACDGKVMSAVVRVVVPSLRQQVKRGGIKSGETGYREKPPERERPFSGYSSSSPL